MTRSAIFPVSALITLLAAGSVAYAVTQVCPALGFKLVRPIQMGASIGVVDANGRTHCAAGTAGILVSNSSEQQEILSNNHVGAAHSSPDLVEDGILVPPDTVGSVWSQLGPFYSRDPIWLVMSKLGLNSIVGRTCAPTETTISLSPSLSLVFDNSTETPASGVMTPAPDGTLPIPANLPPDPVFAARANAAEHLKAALYGIPHFWYVDFAHKENGLDDRTLLVMVDKVTPQIMDRVPKEYDGYPVKIEVYAGGPNTDLLDNPGSTRLPQGCHKVETKTDRKVLCDPTKMAKPVIINPQ